MRYCPAGQGSSSSPLLSQQPKEDTAALSLGEVLTQLGAASCPGVSLHHHCGQLSSDGGAQSFRTLSVV